MNKRTLVIVVRALAICATAAVTVETARDLIARSRYLRSHPPPPGQSRPGSPTARLPIRCASSTYILLPQVGRARSLDKGAPGESRGRSTERFSIRSPLVLATSLHQLEISRLPALIEPRLERGVETGSALERFDLEGIVATRKADPYAPSTTWLTVKNRADTQTAGRGDLFHPHPR